MKLNKKLVRFLRRWLPLALVIVALSGLVYLSMQQLLRQSVNDPQIQMAEDAAAALSAGKAMAEVIPADQVEISTSLAPFLMVFDDSGKLLVGNALLDGRVPQYPSGVFEYVRQRGEDRVTWQPRTGVRQATVVTRFNGAAGSGFVVAGRSLRESENRSDYFLMIASAAGFFSLAGSAILCWFFLDFPRKVKSALKNKK